MITVIGDIIADILVRKEGATNYATDTEGSIQLRAGGQAFNVASWIAHEGEACRLMARVGADPFGTFLLDECQKYGIDASEMTIDREHQTGKIVILIENETGERSMITDRGANMYLADEDLRGLKGSQALYLSGYSFFTPALRPLLQQAKEIALRQQIPIAFDPSSTYYLQKQKEELLAFLSGITFLTPNYEEGVMLTGEKEPAKIVAALKRYVAHPILTLGQNGCAMMVDGETVYLPAPSVNAVDATGAGDSFIGSFLAAYVRHGDLLQAAQRAVEISANVVAHVGASPQKNESAINRE